MLNSYCCIFLGAVKREFKRDFTGIFKHSFYSLKEIEMSEQGLDQKSILYKGNQKIGFFLICFGVIFILGIGITFLTPDNEGLFTPIFFSFSGLVMMVVGIIMTRSIKEQRRKEGELKAKGERIISEAAECIYTGIRAGGHRLYKLTCTGIVDGKTYLFRSGMLIINPVSRLTNKQVIVYYNRDNINQYYVDVDGSIY
jgi:hypothetical protein